MATALTGLTALTVVDAIGVGSALLTTVGFLQANIAASAPPEGSTVKIKGTRPTAASTI